MDKKKFVKDYNNLEKFQTIKSLSDKYGISSRTILRRKKALEKEGFEFVDRTPKPSEEKYCPYCSHHVHRRGKCHSGGKKVQEYKCKSCGKRTTKPLNSPDEYEDIIDEQNVKQILSDIVSMKKTKDVTRYVITSVQNNTNLNKKFFRSLQSYCDHNDCKLLAIPIMYKNPTRDRDERITDCWYPAEIQKYLVNKPIILNKNLVVMADIKIQATAVDPLSGMDNLSGTRSAIYGHSQLRMKTVPTPQDVLPKMLHTTGSLSEKNYSDTKAGAKGKFHHTNSALVVECSGNRFHIRELSCDSSGAFYDLDKHYDGERVKGGYRVDGIVLGDEHIMFMDESVKKCTFTDKDSIINTLRPKQIVRHDSVDAYSISHHHTKNRITSYVKAVSGANDLRAELNQFVDHINNTTPKDSKSVIVASNHNDHLCRWLSEFKHEKDPYNALIYHELSSKVFASARFTENGVVHDHPLEVYSRDKLTCDYEFITRRKSYLINGIDCSQHGDIGANGARGNVNAFARSSYKSIIGHSHAPAILQGVYQVGTSSNLQLEYNSGLSGWLQSHCVIYPNGKRSMLHIIDGHWKA